MRKPCNDRVPTCIVLVWVEVNIMVCAVHLDETTKDSVETASITKDTRENRGKERINDPSQLSTRLSEWNISGTMPYRL
jgi:hypothetical protein